MASGSIVAAFGTGLLVSTARNTGPLLDTLAGATIDIVDSTGQSRRARLFYVSAKQCTYELPAETATGWALARITAADGTATLGSFQVTATGPGVFSASATGSGPAAAVAARYSSGALKSYSVTAVADPRTNTWIATPIDLAPIDEDVVLELYGVGVRNSALDAVQVAIGGRVLAAQYAGPAPGYPGVDQINVALPRSLAGAGAVDVQLSAGGLVSNVVQIQIQ